MTGFQQVLHGLHAPQLREVAVHDEALIHRETGITVRIHVALHAANRIGLVFNACNVSDSLMPQADEVTGGHVAAQALIDTQ